MTHKIYHSREVSETNSNYANLLTIYDRLLGTYKASSRAESIVYGLDAAGRMSAASVRIWWLYRFDVPNPPNFLT